MFQKLLDEARCLLGMENHHIHTRTSAKDGKLFFMESKVKLLPRLEMVKAVRRCHWQAASCEQAERQAASHQVEMTVGPWSEESSDRPRLYIKRVREAQYCKFQMPPVLAVEKYSLPQILVINLDWQPKTHVSKVLTRGKMHMLTSPDCKGGIFGGRASTPVRVPTRPSIQDIGTHRCWDLSA